MAVTLDGIVADDALSQFINAFCSIVSTPFGMKFISVNPLQL